MQLIELAIRAAGRTTSPSIVSDFVTVATAAEVKKGGKGRGGGGERNGRHTLHATARPRSPLMLPPYTSPQFLLSLSEKRGGGKKKKERGRKERKEGGTGGRWRWSTSPFFLFILFVGGGYAWLREKKGEERKRTGGKEPKVAWVSLHKV